MKLRKLAALSLAAAMAAGTLAGCSSKPDVYKRQHRVGPWQILGGYI